MHDDDLCVCGHKWDEHRIDGTCERCLCGCFDSVDAPRDVDEQDVE